MKNRKVNIRNLSIVIIFCIIALLFIGSAFYFFILRNDIAFYIDGKEMKEYEVVLSADDSLEPKDLKLTAMMSNGEDVTQKITYDPIEMKPSQTYTVEYRVEEGLNTATFHLFIEVKEEVRPVVSNEDDKMYTDPRSITPAIITPDSIGVLVNKYHAIPDGWEPSDLVQITSNNGRDMYLRSEAAAAWEQLNINAKALGIEIYVVSSFRTASYQEGLFDNYYAIDGANAFLYSALPRRSEHELGLAIDVSNDDQLHEDLLNHAVGQFMNDEGYKYGFILRYPENKMNITGYGFEAWHYRYVGVELATKLKNRGIVLEEYYEEK